MDCCSAGVGHALELPQRLCTWEADKWVNECDGSRGDESVALTGWPSASNVAELAKSVSVTLLLVKRLAKGITWIGPEIL